MRVLVLIAIACLVGGCGIGKGFEAADNRAELSKIQLGMSKAQVVEIMGPAYKTSARAGLEGVTEEEMYYITEWIRDGETTASEMTVLGFRNDKLIGWGGAEKIAEECAIKKF